MLSLALTRVQLAGLSLCLLTSLALTGCNSYSENSLVGDFVSASKCPANGCANQAADQNYISIKVASTLIQVQANENRTEVAGDCYPSTFPQNQIVVTTLQNSVTPVLSAVINTSTVEATPFCKNGRFSFVMGTGHLPAGTYNVKLELVGIDAAGARYTNAAGGRATFSLRK
jgi:hypothetical protein